MRARYTPPSTRLPNTIPTHPPPATRINSNSFLFSFEAVPVRGLIFLKTSHTWTVANDTRLFHHFHASYLTRSHFRKSPETYNFHVTVVVPTLKHANRYTDIFQPITAKVVSRHPSWTWIPQASSQPSSFWIFLALESSFLHRFPFLNISTDNSTKLLCSAHFHWTGFSHTNVAIYFFATCDDFQFLFLHFSRGEGKWSFDFINSACMTAILLSIYISRWPHFEEPW